MKHAVRALPITEDDAVIAGALENASVPTLMMSIVHLTGDASLLRGDDPPQAAPVIGEVTAACRDGGEGGRARAWRSTALRAYRDRGCTLPPPPSRRDRSAR